MKVLLTRPSDQSVALAKIITPYKLSVYIAPLLEVRNILKIELETISDFSHILVTSSNALPAILDLPKNTKLLVVGENNYKTAKEFGFINIELLGNQISDFKNRLKLYNTSNILYASGHHVTDSLQEYKFIKRVIVYKAEEVIVIPDQMHNFMLSENNSLKKKIALFYSQRTAKIFLNLLRKNNLVDKTSDIITLSLSERIANHFKEMNFSSNLVAEKMNSKSLIEKLVKKLHE